MKTVCKISLPILLVISLLWPSLSIAVTDSATNADQGAGDPQLCANLDGIAKKITNRFTVAQEKLNALQKKRVSAIDEAFKRKEKRLTIAYSAQESARAKSVSQLEQKAKTDNQQEAVNAFKTALDRALGKKREAITVAIADFKDGFTKLAAKRDGDVKELTANFKEAIAKAIASAKTDCSDSKDTTSIQTSLKNALHDARQTFIDGRTKLTSYQDALQSLQSAFKNTWQKAADNVKETLQETRTTLERAFPLSQP